MKSIMLSIQPKWCELIASGKKTIEVRKTRPKLETPFKCYIYCTKSKEIMFNVFLNEPEKEVEYLSGKVIGEFVCDRIDKYSCEFWNDTPDFMDKDHAMEQIRISYFDDHDDCECEEEFEYMTGNEVDNPDDCELCRQTCLTYSEIRKYVGIGDKIFHGWHISDLKIYDTPKELGEFCVRNNHPNCDQCAYIPVGMHPQEFVWHNDFCGECSRLSYKSMWATHFRKRLARPPQSWCYVEELKR